MPNSIGILHCHSGGFLYGVYAYFQKLERYFLEKRTTVFSTEAQRFHLYTLKMPVKPHTPTCLDKNSPC